MIVYREMVCSITVHVYHRIYDRVPGNGMQHHGTSLPSCDTVVTPRVNCTAPPVCRSSVRQRRPREEAGGRWRHSLHLPPADEYITLRLLQCQSSPATLQRTESPRTVIREKLRDRKGGFIPFSRRFAGRRPANLQGRAKRRPALK